MQVDTLGRMMLARYKTTARQQQTARARVTGYENRSRCATAGMLTPFTPFGSAGST
jgi:hypothetical protein